MTDVQPVYLNLASKEDLEEVPAIGDRADAIVEQRPFQDWSDLRRAGFETNDINNLKSAGVQLGSPGEGPLGEPGSGGGADRPGGNLGRA